MHATSLTSNISPDPEWFLNRQKFPKRCTCTCMCAKTLALSRSPEDKDLLQATYELDSSWIWMEKAVTSAS